MKNSTVKNGLRTLFLINPNRIAWVDVAKGIAILLVIIGHTVNFGSATRNFIFSFHMPLFFILSGYTFKLAGDFPVFFQRVKKLIRHLIYPSLIVSGIGTFCTMDDAGSAYSLCPVVLHQAHGGGALVGVWGWRTCTSGAGCSLVFIFVVLVQGHHGPDSSIISWKENRIYLCWYWPVRHSDGVEK